MYRDAKLVHGDLSAYNILFNEELQKFFIIDVSQAVLYDHPEADRFLLRDLNNINQFFLTRAVKPIELAKLYRWVTGDDANEGDLLRILHSDFE
jgi:RIO kinase 1